METANLKEIFDKGYEFESFKGTKENPNNMKIEEFIKELKIDSDLEKRIKEIEKTNNVLCFGENWCPDCVINESIMHKISELRTDINIKFVGRDGYEDLVSSYDENGKAKIPLIIVMDNDFKVKGSFNEIPAKLSHIVKTGTQPEIIVAKRNYRKGEWVKETVDELIGLLEK